MKLSKRKRNQQKAMEIGNFTVFLLLIKLNFLCTDLDTDEPSLKKKLSLAPTIVFSRPQRACRQKIINYQM